MTEFKRCTMRSTVKPPEATIRPSANTWTWSGVT